MHTATVNEPRQTKLPCRIGVKLPASGATDREWEDLLSPFDDPLRYLAEAGVDYLEHACGSLADAEERRLLAGAASDCGARGLGMAMHPYLGGEFNPARFGRSPRCREAVERILSSAADAASVTGRQTVVVLHPAEADRDPRRDRDRQRQRLLAVSRRFARELEAKARPLGPQVVVAMEHQVPPNPGEELLRIGDTFEELLQAVGDTDLPLCWDTGHYLLAVERHGQDPYPPDEFLDRVEHVHLHAVIDGQDHRPVTSHSDVLERYLRSLWQRGFGGGVTLEYAADGVAREGGLTQALEGTLRVLRRWAGRGEG